MSSGPILEERARRIAERLEAVGLSERAASILATGQPDALRFMRTRGTMPSAARLMKLAKVLEASPEYLTGESDRNQWAKDQGFVELASTIDETARVQFSEGRVVPVFGSIAYGEDQAPIGKDQVANDVIVYHFQREVLAFAAAPLGTVVGKLGAFYPADTIMSPVFEPNVPVVFVHDQEANIGEYGLIFFGPGDMKTMNRTFALRRIVDRGDDWLTIEQLNPPAKRRIDNGLVTATWKVLSLRDYVVPIIPHTKSK